MSGTFSRWPNETFSSYSGAQFSRRTSVLVLGDVHRFDRAAVDLRSSESSSLLICKLAGERVRFEEMEDDMKLNKAYLQYRRNMERIFQGLYGRNFKIIKKLDDRRVVKAAIRDTARRAS